MPALAAMLVLCGSSMRDRTGRGYLAGLLEIHEDGGDIPDADLEELLHRDHSRTSLKEGLARDLLLGSMPDLAGIPTSLSHLGRVWCSSIATPEQQTQALLEASRQLLAAGYAVEASQCLARTPDGGRIIGTAIGLQVQALAGLVRVELGRGQRAASDSQRILDRLPALEGGLGSRARQKLLSDAGQTLLAIHLRATNRALGLGSRVAANDCEGEVASVSLLRWHSLLSSPGTATQASETRAFVALVSHALEAQAVRRTADLIALVLDFKLRGGPIAAETWSWLGTACRLSGDHQAARRCHAAACLMARHSGRGRIEWMSRAELANVFATAGEMSLAYDALDELRRGEQLLAASWPYSMGTAWHARMEALEPTPPTSQDSPAAGHVLRARKAIHAGIRDNMTTMDVAAACGVSRRTLELAFRDQLGTSVRSYVAAARIAAVQRAVELSFARPKTLAVEFGYTSAASLGRHFRRETGISIGQFMRSLERAKDETVQQDP